MVWDGPRHIRRGFMAVSKGGNIHFTPAASRTWACWEPLRPSKLTSFSELDIDSQMGVVHVPWVDSAVRETVFGPSGHKSKTMVDSL